MYNREKIMSTLRNIRDELVDVAPYVVVAQPRRIRGEIAAQKLEGGHSLHVDIMGMSHGFVDIYGEKVDVARNYLIERVLESGAKYMFFVGEDTVVPYDGFKILHETAEKNPGSIVCGVYYIKMSNPMITVQKDKWLVIPDVSPGQLINAWSVGMDCMLIPVDILRRMKEQDPDLPFTCIANDIEDLPFIGEDNFFTYRARNLGVPILVNTDVQCLHIDLATGKYTAHPSVDLQNYITNIKITEPLKIQDKKFIDERWIKRLPQGSNSLTNKIKGLQENNIPVKFNMGCGDQQLEGYINVDNNSEFADVTEDVLDYVPPAECADEILASHMIEHVHHAEVPPLLAKWYETLKPGGKLVIETPDLEAMCKEFVDADEQRRHILGLCMYGAFANYASPEAVRNGTASPHLWGFWTKPLVEILTNIGFKNIDVKHVVTLNPNIIIEATK